MNVSFSEAEYNEAYRLHKTCLVYLRDDNVPILPKYIESNPENHQRLQALKNFLGQRHTTAKFRDPNDLALQVAADLSRTIQTLEQVPTGKTERMELAQDNATRQITRAVGEALGKGVAEQKSFLSFAEQCPASS
jgi:O6-methylguanine-DNA--protein-cysteine methyltransferase